MGQYALRLSVTDRCNLRCRYCMPEGMTGRIPAADLPSLEKLAAAVRWLASVFPISKVKFTGGEPLLRRGIADLIADVAAIPGIGDLSLTTNGSRLKNMAAPLKQAGLKRVNVSLDTLNPLRFRELNGGRLEDTLDGIQEAWEAGLEPIKINAVLRKSCWPEDVSRLLDYASEHGFEPRFIELMETGVAAQWARGEFVPASEVKAWLATKGPVEALSETGGSPARRTHIIWRGQTIIVGWITPQSQPFCGDCNRLRLDAKGRLRRCLMDPLHLALTDCLAAMPPNRVEQLVRNYVSDKLPPLEMSMNDQMAAVGG